MCARILIYFLFLLVLVGCSHFSQLHYDAIVDKNLTGKHYFNSLQAALDAAPSGARKPYRIYIKPGHYYEKLTLTKPHIHLIGSDKNNTRIFFNAYAGQISTATNAKPGQTWGTPGSATLTIQASDIHLQQLTVENSFNFLTNDALANEAPERIINAQAVALHLDAGSDKIVVSDVRLLGYQDTLFANAGRSWFDKTVIAGNVDFIFGKGNALFTHSEIKTLGRGKPNNPHGYLAAPSTNISNEYGFTFIDCILTRAKSVPDNSVHLGRPWHPTTQFTDGRYADPNAIGKAVFINSWMDSHITRDGWHSMNGTARNGTKILFLAEDARFFEYQSKGPGAVINSTRRQLTTEEVQHFTREKILGDWDIQ